MKVWCHDTFLFYFGSLLFIEYFRCHLDFYKVHEFSMENYQTIWQIIYWLCKWRRTYLIKTVHLKFFFFLVSYVYGIDYVYTCSSSRNIKYYCEDRISQTETFNKYDTSNKRVVNRHMSQFGIEKTNILRRRCPNFLTIG